MNPGFSDPNSTDPTKKYCLNLTGWAACTNNSELCFGTAARADPFVRGFGYLNEDMNLYKDT